MVKVYVKKTIKENCDTCLYQCQNGLMNVCGNANVSKDTFYKCKLLSIPCQHYWLNQHKYRRAENG